MNHKGFINIILILVVTTIIGLGAYFISIKTAVAPTPSQNPIAIDSALPTASPSPTPDASAVVTSSAAPTVEEIIKKVGERESAYQIQKINKDSVEGVWHNIYPIERPNDPGTPKVLHIGDNIGIACEGVMEILSSIDFAGQTVTFQKRVGKPPMGGCPICLAENTTIDTPAGAVPVKELQNGSTVWTTDAAGNRISGTILKTAKVAVPPTHQMVKLILDDGRELLVSPGHPTTDGKTVGELAAGDIYDEAEVESAEQVTYDEGFTYDILPSGETGHYWANGILVGSTLR